MISFDIIFCLSVQKNMLQNVKNELIDAGDRGHRYRKSGGHVLHMVKASKQSVVGYDSFVAGCDK